MTLEKWEWAWLAGIFEGEGCISFTNYNSLQIRIAMTDKDVIEAIDRLFPTPNGLRLYEYAPQKKNQWVWAISSKLDVETFLHGVMPFLYSRRQARAHEALARSAKNRGDRSKRTHCPRNHPLAGENLYVKKDGARSCLECRKARDLRRNAEQKEKRRVARELRQSLSSPSP